MWHSIFSHTAHLELNQWDYIVGGESQHWISVHAFLKFRFRLVFIWCHLESNFRIQSAHFVPGGGLFFIVGSKDRILGYITVSV
jgi:uncharacterized MAPEG superfamily protein